VRCVVLGVAVAIVVRHRYGGIIAFKQSWQHLPPPPEYGPSVGTEPGETKEVDGQAFVAQQ
jgi:hypothetical protein